MPGCTGVAKSTVDTVLNGTIDAIEGAVANGDKVTITGFLSVGPKLGAFALLVRLFAEGLAPQRADWVTVIAVLAVLTMTVEPIPGGAIVRASGLTPTQGWWNAELVPRDLDENGVLVY